MKPQMSSKVDTGKAEEEGAPSPKESPDITWQCDRSLPDCNLYMLQNEVATDVTFVFRVPGSEDIVMHAHKYILTARSPVFYKLFYHSIPDSQERVLIDETSPKIFKELLRYMYSDTAIINPQNALELLQVSNKYKVDTLRRKCSTFLESQITSDNVCSILDQATSFEEDGLMTKCLDLVISSGSAVLKSESIKSVSQRALKTILSCDGIFVPEIIIFEVCVAWAKSECARTGLPETDKNMREVLGPLLYQVRFPLIPLSQFSSRVVPSGLLSLEEENSVFRYMTFPKADQVLPFPNEPRAQVHIANFSSVLQSATKVKKPFGHKHFHTVTFSRRVLLVAVELGLSSPCAAEVTLVLEGCQEDLSRQLTAVPHSGNSTETMRVDLQKPVTVDANKAFTASIYVQKQGSTHTQYFLKYFSDGSVVTSLNGRINASKKIVLSDVEVSVTGEQSPLSAIVFVKM